MDNSYDKNLKEPPKSYWLASTPTTDYPSLNEDIEVDIVIIGGGLAGISSAYLLEKEGFKIAILEADRICQGTTAHTTAKITSQHDLIYNKLKNKMGIELARQYAEANEWAINKIKEIVEENNIQCDFISQSAYVFTQDEKYVGAIENEIKVASELGIKASFIDEIPFPIPIKAAVRFDNQAQFHPRKYLLALAEILHDKGVSIYENTRAVNIEEDDGYAIITENKNRIRAKWVIIASQYPFYNKRAMYFARLFPIRSYIVGVKAREKYPGGMYINVENPTRSLRHQATEDGELILVVGSNHTTGQDHDTDKHYEELIDFAHDIFTVEDIPYRWSTQDYITLDGVPYIGRFTMDTPKIYVATGFQQWGMTNSMVAAMIIRDLIMKGESRWQDVYNPSRKTIMASAKNFLVENLNVAAYLLSGKLSPLPEDVDIQPGEGKVLKLDGERIGAYRSQEGTLHLVNTTCPHMGCELNWNSAEKSWDCPCHGSRFTHEGEIIEGPAVKPLRAGNDVNTLEKLIKDDY